MARARTKTPGAIPTAVYAFQVTHNVWGEAYRAKYRLPGLHSAGCRISTRSVKSDYCKAPNILTFFAEVEKTLLLFSEYLRYYEHRCRLDSTRSSSPCPSASMMELRGWPSQQSECSSPAQNRILCEWNRHLGWNTTHCADICTCLTALLSWFVQFLTHFNMLLILIRKWNANFSPN